MINDKANEVNRCQIELESSMRGSDFIFDCVYLFYYIFHKITSNDGGSYIDSPDWMRNNKTTINPIFKKKDNKWFQYAVTIVLSYEEIGKKP